MAILRFLGHKAGLIPTDAVEAAQAEGASEQVNDVAGAIYGVVFMAGSDEEKAAAMATLKESKLPGLLKGLVAQAGESAFIGGSKPSIADILLLSFSEGFTSYGVHMLEGAPTLQAIAARTAALPQLAAYILRRAVVEAAEKA
jgi:glutathione S-transferase